MGPVTEVVVVANEAEPDEVEATEVEQAGATADSATD